MSFLRRLQELTEKGEIPEELTPILAGFYDSYEQAILSNGGNPGSQEEWLNTFLDLIVHQCRSPFSFNPYHHRITQPFDYYRFGLDFLRPLVLHEKSSVLGEEKIIEIEACLGRQENVILLSNHQTEPDPQAISLLLENAHPALAEEMIFVAGHRVTTDPLAIPFSMGRNLLCIYSKNYIEHPPEKKHEKMQHNQKTMKKMRDLLEEGGKCIYVAPSGGRDRPNSEGIVEVASFDPQSIEMFWFLAKNCGKPTRFYPLALSTFDLLPPPNGIKIGLGENRKTKSTPIHLAFGDEINMVDFPGSECEDKKERKIFRSDFIWSIVKNLYDKIR